MAFTVQNIQFFINSHIHNEALNTVNPNSIFSIMRGKIFAVQAHKNPIIKGFNQPVFLRFRLKK